LSISSLHGEHGVDGFVSQRGERGRQREKEATKHEQVLRERGGRAVCQRWGGRLIACRIGLERLKGLAELLKPERLFSFLRQGKCDTLTEWSRPSKALQIVFSNRLDLYHKSLDSGSNQGDRKGQFDQGECDILAAWQRHPPPSPLHPPPSTLHPPPSTLHPPPSTRHPPPSTLHPPPSTLHSPPPPPTLHPKPSTLNPTPQTPNPKPRTPHLQPSTLNTNTSDGVGGGGWRVEGGAWSVEGGG